MMEEAPADWVDGRIINGKGYDRKVRWLILRLQNVASDYKPKVKSDRIHKMESIGPGHPVITDANFW